MKAKLILHLYVCSEVEATASCGNITYYLQSNQVKLTPQDSINEFINQKLNPLVVLDFRFISTILHA